MNDHSKNNKNQKSLSSYFVKVNQFSKFVQVQLKIPFEQHFGSEETNSNQQDP